MAMGLGFLGRGSRRLATPAAGMHVLGSSIGGAVTGALFAGLGSLLWLPRWRMLIVGSAAFLSLALSLIRLRIALWPQRQVPRGWGQTLPGPLVYFLWGAMLGSGVITVIPYTSMVVLVAIQLTGPVGVAAAAGAVFGFARALPALLPLVARPYAKEPPRAATLVPVLQASAARFNWALIVGGGTVIAVAGLR